MANGVTQISASWQQVPAGDEVGNYAENALAALLEQGGAMEGETLITALKQLGYPERGPAYYPAGPYYALGNPHTYAALSGDRSAWDLHLFDPNDARKTPGGRLPSQPPPQPPPPGPPLPAAVHAQLLAIASQFDAVAQAFRDLAAIILGG